MLKNYLLIALRNMKTHKGYSFINITGLALGMAFTLLILLWIQDEASYDRFHENAGELHRVVLKFQNAGGETHYAITTPGPLAGVLTATLPEISKSTRFLRRRWGMGTTEKRFAEVGAITVYSQMRYMSNRNLGFDKKNILWLEMRSELAQKYEVFKNELLKNPNIVSLTRSNTTPDVNESSAEGREVHWQGRSANDGFAAIHFATHAEMTNS